MKRIQLILLVGLLLAPGLYIQAQHTLQEKQKQSLAPVSPALSPRQVVRGAQTQTVPRAGSSYQPVGFTPAQPIADFGYKPLDTRYAPETGLPIYFRSETGAENLSAGKAALEQRAFELLEDWKPLMRIQQPNEEFLVTRIETDALNMTHVRMQQQYQGIPVYGAEVMLHFAPDGSARFNGRYAATPSLVNVVPGLGAETAVQTAIQDVSQHTTYVVLSEQQKNMLNYPAPATELVFYQPEGPVRTHRLAWHITLRPNFLQRWEYFIDAHTGEVLHSYDHTCSIGDTQVTATDLNGVSRSIRVFQPNSGPYYMLDVSKGMYTSNPGSGTLPDNGTGFILTADMNNTNLNNPSYSEVTSNNNTWAPSAVSAHYNASVSYDYYTTVHGRTSINGQGGDVVSFINVADDNGGGMDNAFWNGQFMFYGNGNQAFSSPLARSLDVGGHEMTHGVIQNTANLEYQGQSGALNESFADIFAVAIEFRDEGNANDWVLGEDIVNPAFFPTGALRSMLDPHNGGSSLNDNGYQPKHMSEIYTGSQDNGGVHINSGIPNHAFYRYATAAGMNRSKAEQVYYRALAMYLGRSSKFIDCRIAVVNAATDLFGANSTEVSAARTAFDQVGILNGNATPTQTNIPTNPGVEFIVSTDVNPQDNNQLYISSTIGTNFQALSTTPHRNKISVTDDGSKGFFVGQDGFIRRINLNASNPQEQILYSSLGGIWDNVAVSKDGRRLAAVTQFVDTSIYIFDYSMDPTPYVQYILYNPTFTQGVNSGGVRYADAIEWDYSGEYVMYDAFNQLPNSSNTDVLEYWDVAFLRGWDSGGNDFGDGFISKLFTSLPEGISVGEAVFSKNSPHIIAFDVIDGNTGENFVQSANIETGDIGTIAQNAILGIPCYSKDDSKVVISALNNADEVVSVVNMNPDKLNAAAAPVPIIGDAKWPVWYATGSRTLPTAIETEPDLLLGDIRLFPNPTAATATLRLHLSGISQVAATLYNAMGQQIRPLLASQQVAAGQLEIPVSVEGLPAGLYLIRVEAAGTTTSLKLYKE